MNAIATIKHNCLEDVRVTIYVEKMDDGYAAMAENDDGELYVIDGCDALSTIDDVENVLWDKYGKSGDVWDLKFTN